MCAGESISVGLARLIYFVIFLFVLNAPHAFSQGRYVDPNQNWDTVTSERFPEAGWSDVQWTNPGNWTKVDVTTLGIVPGSSEAAALLQQAIDNADVPTVFYFPPGEYILTNSIDVRNDQLQRGPRRLDRYKPARPFLKP